MQTLSKEIEKRIENIVSVRFYNQITPYDVIRWLFNFDDEDVNWQSNCWSMWSSCVMTM